MLEKKFSHVANFTGYMELVFEIVVGAKSKQRILDIPAGNGLLSAQLRLQGHDVICADINQHAKDYVYADLSQPLPFATAEFDTCLCLEGIEHVVDSAALVRELCRVTKPGGRIILSLPNIQNAFSRLHFLTTGCFYQFPPWMSRHLKPGELIDRGHIAPLSFMQLRYLFEEYGTCLIQVAGDKWKKKWIIPFLAPLMACGRIWMNKAVGQQKETPVDECRQTVRFLFSKPLMFSRSLILVFRRG
ncbi:MAG: class I SAM-dependent methyltransferase [Verrucomicrobia bacterium]|nr:class I SAM-dependent methyltransferase [Verrucomicrobiota bacterium]